MKTAGPDSLYRPFDGEDMMPGMLRTGPTALE
jgi:hypothetical protein